jgi:vacuole morphology and inheritance protein 14
MDAVAMSEIKLTEDLHSLETTIRSALAEGNHDRIAKIVHQLCHDYAYAVHQPHARNGGLIGLAAAAIALGAVSLLSCLS